MFFCVQFADESVIHRVRRCVACGRGLSELTTFTGCRKFVSRAGEASCATFHLDLTSRHSCSISDDLVRVFKNGRMVSRHQLSLSVRSPNQYQYNISMCSLATGDVLENGTYQLVLYNTNQTYNTHFAELTLVHSFDLLILPRDQTSES